MRTAYVQQRGESACTGHGQVEQDQFDLGVLIERAFQRGGTGHFDHVDLRQRLTQGMHDRSAEQRVVIGDQDGDVTHARSVACHPAHCRIRPLTAG